ncbi:MAG TPA: allantoinase AllB [Polyangiaceae bacterium LLY-WYZ-15_(1-7)]|nr:allantoinase AllB [Myxococcales bacterium]MAT24694.1 allantoinase AllB [Sandaracinus sp.]HJL02025.1 allantoinase AllB [Polyangiaceae bacterium LLY-WYZ-15_(1-7)]HJL13945.1 allantoinase AllB [Polyangiaceae bacterium LLY-WYZ-15_(1-7)]HJL26939.1 allantoinase AllB [Polyangiaceae bacterium LLY-WYZ-15_(1-7)]
MERAFRSRRVVTPDGTRAATVLTKDGRITALEPHALPIERVELVDVGDAWLVPGAVDTHVHLNEPGRTEWEGFATATAAAAAGGITTLVDMPLNCIPATTDVAALEAKRAAAAGQLQVDVGFYGGVVPGNAEALEPLADAGVLGFKCFLIDSGVEEFPHVDAGDLRAALPHLARRGLPLLAHCELPVSEPPTSPDPRSYRAWLDSRPRAWEQEAIELLIALGEEAGCRTHVVHLACADALDAIGDAKLRGAPLSVETCPHYLSFAAEEIPDGDPRFKCAPPIRERDQREGLWEGLRDGRIDFVVSDHSPCAPALKHLEEGDVAQAWGGIAGLQLSLSATWTGALRRRVPFEEVVRWTSSAPAAFAGLKHKGAIAPGFDADLVVFDPDAEIEVDARELKHRHDVTPYAGQRLRGRVEATWLRGERVYDRRSGLAPRRRGAMLEGGAT